MGRKLLTEIEAVMFGDLMEDIEWPLNLRLNIREGIAKTYPMDKVIKFLYNECNVPYRFIRKTMNNKHITIDIPRSVWNKKIIENIDRLMTLCGWYLGNNKFWKDSTNRWFASYNYEPRYALSSDIYPISGEYIYHISPKKYMNKILKQGFCPSDKSFRFNYPSRNYFFTNNQIEFKRWVDEFNKSKNTDEPYVLYKVDTRPLEEQINNGEIVFYIDENLNGGIYTTSNIPPSCIVSVEDIN